MRIICKALITINTLISWVFDYQPVPGLYIFKLCAEKINPGFEDDITYVFTEKIRHFLINTVIVIYILEPRVYFLRTKFENIIPGTG